MSKPDATNKYRKRTYRQRLRERAFATIGHRCVFCGSPDEVHAAHVRDTGLNGAGRGLDRRFRDVLQHPDAYRPMCKRCHRVYDQLVPSKPAVEEPIPY